MNPHEFKTRKLHKMPKDEFEALRNDGIIPCTNQNCELADDWMMVVPEDVTDVKYGRFMYSPSLNVLRHQTMGEFYGGGIVD